MSLDENITEKISTLFSDALEKEEQLKREIEEVHRQYEANVLDYTRIVESEFRNTLDKIGPLYQMDSPVGDDNGAEDPNDVDPSYSGTLQEIRENLVSSLDPEVSLYAGECGILTIGSYRALYRPNKGDFIIQITGINREGIDDTELVKHNLARIVSDHSREMNDEIREFRDNYVVRRIYLPDEYK